MSTFLTYADLAERWRCSKRKARDIARDWNLSPQLLAPRMPRFRVSEVAKAERQKTLSS